MNNKNNNKDMYYVREDELIPVEIVGRSAAQRGDGMFISDGQQPCS